MVLTAVLTVLTEPARWAWVGDITTGAEPKGIESWSDRFGWLPDKRLERSIGTDVALLEEAARHFRQPQRQLHEADLVVLQPVVLGEVCEVVHHAENPSADGFGQRVRLHGL